MIWPIGQRSYSSNILCFNLKYGIIERRKIKQKELLDVFEVISKRLGSETNVYLIGGLWPSTG